MRRIIIGVSREIEYDLRNDFFAHLQRLPPEYFRRHRTGDLMSRATNDLNAVRMMAGPVDHVCVADDARLRRRDRADAVDRPAADADRRCCRCRSCRSRSRSSAPPSTGGSSASRRSSPSSAPWRRRTSRACASCAPTARSARSWRVPRRQRGVHRAQSRADSPAGRVLPEHDAAARALARCWCCGRAAATSSRGGSRVGELVAFNAYLVMLAWPMIAFGWVTNMLQRGMASWKRMLEMLDEAPSIADPAASGAARRRCQSRGLVEVRDLTFSLRPADRCCATSISSSSPGRRRRSSAPTGSGKSTLLQLLPRLLDPPPGTVFIDGVDVRELPLVDAARASSAWRRRSRSSSRTRSRPTSPLRRRSRRCLPERAARGRWNSRPRWRGSTRTSPTFPRASTRSSASAASRCRAGRSSARRWRARSSTDPRVLVLDDALSAVDTYTEEEILQRLKQVRRGRTCLIVAHRVSTVRDADVIFVLDEGRIVERGIARRARRARRRVCGAASQAIAGRGAGSDRGRRCGRAVMTQVRRLMTQTKHEGRRTPARRTRTSDVRLRSSDAIVASAPWSRPH